MLNLVAKYLFVINFVSSIIQCNGFAPDTPIYVSEKEITPIQVLAEDSLDEDQYVLSFDLKKSKCATRKIRSAATVQTDCYYAIALANESGDEICCTPDQLFYNPITQQWVAAQDLKVSDCLLTKDNTVIAITAIRFVQEPLLCYALSVRRTPYFFVSKQGVLVHNMVLRMVTATLGSAFGAGAASGCFTGALSGPVSAATGVFMGGCLGMLVKSICAPSNVPHYERRYPDYRPGIFLFAESAKNSEAQASGKPTEKDGFFPKKNWDGKKVRHPETGQYGYPDKKGEIWVPTGPGPLAHGGPHWDVVSKDGKSHRNVLPGGKIRGQ